MYALFYSKYSDKCSEIIHNMDKESKKNIRLISVDNPTVREVVKKYIKEVPCLVIKEKGKMYICEYDILIDTFPPIPDEDSKLKAEEPVDRKPERPVFSNEAHQQFSVKDKKDPKKIDMDTVRSEMARRDSEIKQIDSIRKPPESDLPSSVKGSSLMGQYSMETKDSKNSNRDGSKSKSSGTSVESINDFFKYNVVEEL